MNALILVFFLRLFMVVLQLAGNRTLFLSIFFRKALIILLLVFSTVIIKEPHNIHVLDGALYHHVVLH